MRSVFAPSFMVVLLAIAPSLAWADMLPDPGHFCRAKARGDACSVAGKSGWCSVGVCESPEDHEGGPTDAKTAECLVCETERPQPKVLPAGSDSKASGCSVGAPVPVGLGIVLFACAVWLRRRS